MEKIQKTIFNANFSLEDAAEPVVEVPAPVVVETAPVEEPVKKSSKKKAEEATETVEDENREDSN